MKRVILTLSIVAAFAISAVAQIDFSDPKWAPWGETAEEREKNLFSSQFLKEALDSKNFDEATKHFNDLVANAPGAASATFQRGAILYKNKINRAKSLAEKNALVDSLIMVYDLRLEHFASDPKYGAVYILDLKARDYAQYKPRDREGMRETYMEALKAAEASAQGMKVDLAYQYFMALTQDYEVDEVVAEDVLAAYDWLSPLFDAAMSDDANVKYAEGFQNAFAASSAASCENLEPLFMRKFEAAPDDADLLARMVAILGRRNCTTSEFYVTIAEKLYSIQPNANSAMGLAAIFQNKGEYDKAVQYLEDALAAETDASARETLLSRIALIYMAAGNMPKAANYAQQSLKASEDSHDNDGVALFILAQAYSASAGSCSGFDAQAIYWVAYDTITRALASFSASEQSYVEPARAMQSSFRSYFPTSEEIFFQELKAGGSYRVNCGLVHGINTTVRTR